MLEHLGFMLNIVENRGIILQNKAAAYVHFFYKLLTAVWIGIAGEGQS